MKQDKFLKVKIMFINSEIWIKMLTLRFKKFRNRALRADEVRIVSRMLLAMEIIVIIKSLSI